MIIINLTHDPSSTLPNILVKVDYTDSSFGYREAEQAIAALIKNILSSLDSKFFHKPPHINYFKVQTNHSDLLDKAESFKISETDLAASADAFKDGSADLVLAERQFVEDLASLCDKKFPNKILSIHYFINAEKMIEESDAPVSTRALIDGVDNNMLLEGSKVLDLINQYLSARMHVKINNNKSFKVLPDNVVEIPFDVIKENSPTKPGDPSAL